MPAIAHAIQQFGPSECRNYFATAGYDAFLSENALGKLDEFATKYLAVAAEIRAFPVPVSQ
jgi:hypothetical protein